MAMFGLGMMGTFILLGMRMRLQARGSQQVDREEVERLADAVDGLAEQVRLLSDETADLSDRLDFAERLLTRGTGSVPPPADLHAEPSPTPL
jgi:hypothetical protein